MVRGLAEAAQAFGRSEYADMATRCAQFLFTKMTRTDASVQGGMLRVLRSYNRGDARIAGYLEDHAALGLAAISVYELTLDEVWIGHANAAGHSCRELFLARDGAGNEVFHDTAADGEALITRPRDITDNAIPAGNSLATELLLLTDEYSGDTAAADLAGRIVAALIAPMAQHPTAFGQLLCATDTLVNGTVQVGIIGVAEARNDFSDEMRMVLSDYFFPSLVLAGGREGESTLPVLAGKTALLSRTTAYLCRRYLCDAPVTSPDDLRNQIENVLGVRGAAAPTAADLR
jgi:uncharacterized protein YyaL (SSP411 family)